MKYLLFILVCVSLSFTVFSQAKKAPPKRPAATVKRATTPTSAATTEKTVYRYNRRQDFNFEAIDVQADYGTGLGDIMVSSRAQDKFKNNLPYRKNFNREIRKSLERIR